MERVCGMARGCSGSTLAVSIFSRQITWYLLTTYYALLTTHYSLLTLAVSIFSRQIAQQSLSWCSSSASAVRKRRFRLASG